MHNAIGNQDSREYVSNVFVTWADYSDLSSMYRDISSWALIDSVVGESIIYNDGRLEFSALHKIISELEQCWETHGLIMNFTHDLNVSDWIQATSVDCFTSVYVFLFVFI